MPLAAIGLVTDDNLATVVQGQKAFLASLQSGIDKRVTDAVNKAKEKEAASGGEQNKQQPNEEPEWFKRTNNSRKSVFLLFKRKMRHSRLKSYVLKETLLFPQKQKNWGYLSGE